jgi:hypothetical protein
MTRRRPKETDPLSVLDKDTGPAKGHTLRFKDDVWTALGDIAKSRKASRAKVIEALLADYQKKHTERKN